jgi:hypothetical protein
VSPIVKSLKYELVPSALNRLFAGGPAPSAASKGLRSCICYVITPQVGKCLRDRAGSESRARTRLMFFALLHPTPNFPVRFHAL